ncbi:hypothetical protein MNBD_ACTINO02-844 [hydrothermal vent metagenome]|uniref:Right handed beta helix domain-containing protein n=1 Tax=hydrothermal vent metagenome TaxID=652676 RepID=A0A3B0SPU8_9ZZZZ
MTGRILKIYATLAFSVLVAACASSVQPAVTSPPPKATTTTVAPATNPDPPLDTVVKLPEQNIVVPAEPPPDPITVSPGLDVEALVNGAPAGTAFIFEPGTYRGVSIKPKDAMSFVAQPGAIFNGSEIIDSFVQQGNVWVATGITAQGRVHGECIAEAPMCSAPEDIYIDSVLSQQVEQANAVGPGTFHIDYESDTLTIGDDPTGRVVELSTTQFAFSGTASDITIDGFVIEKFANPAQTGAIQSMDNRGLGRRWRIANNEVRLNHGVGIKVGAESLVEQNRVYENGQLGIGTGPNGFDNIIRDNEVYANTTIGFVPGYETGGMKLTTQARLLVERNYVYANAGPGIWVDIDNIDVTVADNIVEDNFGPGIFHEISYRAIIRDNTVTGNGFGWTQWVYGAGILVAHSRNVLVTGNTVKDNRLGVIGLQQDRGTGAYGARELRNLLVSDNIIVAKEGSSGIAEDIGNDAVFSDWNNRFELNTYYLTTDEYFLWMGKTLDFTDWNSLGNDEEGTIFNFDSFIDGSP